MDMSLLSRLGLIWDSNPEKIKERASSRPLVVKDKIGTLERALTQGTHEEQVAAAKAIHTAITENTTVGESLDVFHVILHNANSDNTSVREHLVPALGKLAPIVDGEAQREFLASTHILTGLLERDDQHTISQVQPAISRAIREYPDPFLDYTDTIAETITSDSNPVTTSAIETLGVIAGQHPRLVQPHIGRLLEQLDSSRPYQASEALRAVALVASHTPSVVDGTDYLYTLKWMHGQQQPIYEQYAVRSAGYLLSSQPEAFHDEGLVPLLKESLQHQNDHIQKEAAIACLRTIHNTDIKLLNDPDMAHDLNYSINKYALKEEISMTDKAIQDVKTATAD